AKPTQSAAPCRWTQGDLNTLAERFPKDFRPPLYLGLYLLRFSHSSIDFDYQPVFKAFEHAAELKPSSPLPLFYTADPYVVGDIGGPISKANSSCIVDIEPRTTNCLALDDLHRTGVRWLTRAIAADPRFEPAYELRATALLQLKQSRQAIRDFNTAV